LSAFLDCARNSKMMTVATKQKNGKTKPDFCRLFFCDYTSAFFNFLRKPCTLKFRNTKTFDISQNFPKMPANFNFSPQKNGKHNR